MDRSEVLLIALDVDVDASADERANRDVDRPKDLLNPSIVEHHLPVFLFPKESVKASGSAPFAVAFDDFFRLCGSLFCIDWDCLTCDGASPLQNFECPAPRKLAVLLPYLWVRVRHTREGYEAGQFVSFLPEFAAAPWLWAEQLVVSLLLAVVALSWLAFFALVRLEAICALPNCLHALQACLSAHVVLALPA